MSVLRGNGVEGGGEERSFGLPESGWAWGAALLALLLAGCAVGWRGFERGLTWDEVEFFRATKWIGTGLVPYRDFWEHHTPLQWILFSPVARLASGPGVAPVLVMRWAQLPVWVVTFWLIWSGMGRMGLSRASRWVAIATVLASPAFSLFAAEYRVDTLSTFFIVAGLWFWQRYAENPRLAVLGGGAFCAAAIANVRIGPLVAFCILLSMLVPRSRGRVTAERIAGTVIGAGIPFALIAGWLAWHGGLFQAAHQVIELNAMAEALLPRYPLVASVAALLGLTADTARSLMVVLVDVDWAAIILAVVGALGGIAVMRPAEAGESDLRALVVVQAVNILAVVRMKALFGYHFQLVWLLMVPLFAWVLDRAARRAGKTAVFGIALTLLTILLAQTIVNVVFRNTHGSLEYQNEVMTAVNQLTRPDEKVWGGVGFALDRAPAWSPWFLPAMVRLLAQHGALPHYSAQEMLDDPPAAVIFGQRLYLWLDQWPDLKDVVVHQYVPVFQHLWMPGLSARLERGAGSRIWRAPVDGVYGIYAADFLADHPWFTHPLEIGVITQESRKLLELNLPPTPRIQVDGRLSVAVNGVDLGTPTRFRARRGDVVEVQWSGLEKPVGMFILPRPYRRLFVMPNGHSSMDIIGRRFE